MRREACPRRASAAVRRGSGIPLVLIHGNGVDHANLLPLDPAFERIGGFERIYVDLPGFGGTRPLEAPGGLPELAGWLERQIRELVGSRSFALLGQSMGGLLAQEIADRMEEQVRGLALLAPVVYPQAAERNVPPRRVLAPNPRLLAELNSADRAHYEQMSVLQDQANWLRFREHVLPGILSANLRAMSRLSKRYFLDPLPVGRAVRHEFAVLLLCGRQDHVVGFEDSRNLLERYANAEHLILDRAGHNLHIDQPVKVGQKLEAWAQSVLNCEASCQSASRN